MTKPLASTLTNNAPQERESIDSFLARVKSMPPVSSRGGKRGRLLFAMDATMSRQPTWDKALTIQSEMFEATAGVGGLDVQLVYFRGFRECRASKWVSNPQALAQVMTKVSCQGGNTQILRVINHVKEEAKSGGVSTVVYVGDAMEEKLDTLCDAAGQAGMLGVPFFMFQEGSDPAATTAFREIARLTGGAHFQLDSGSAAMLRELLRAAAVYASGGRQALADHARSEGGAARLLLGKLS